MGQSCGQRSTAPPHVKHRVTIRPRRPTPRYTPERSENLCSHKNLHMHVHSRTIHNCQKVEATQVSVHGETDKHNGVHPRSGM